MDAQKPSQPLEKTAIALRKMAVLQQLILEAGNCRSRKELEFHILNRSVEVLSYDRAILWELGGKRAELLGVSGAATVDRHSPLAAKWREILARVPEQEKPFVMVAPRDSGAETTAASGQSVMWLPIPAGDASRFGLLLERWAAPAWTENDMKVLTPLASGYGIALRLYGPRTGVGGFLRRRATWVAVAALAALAAALVLVRVPLRIVAVCEVVPNNPYLVNAPMDGVIEEILVKPGQEVAEGEELFAYSGETVAAEYDVARQQANMARSDLERARAQALANRAVRAQVRILESRLLQEEARLAQAEYRLTRLRVAAGKAGVALLGEPSEWRGRPVATGEGVLLLVDPADSKVRIWLPQDDRIAFDAAAPVLVMLNAESGRSRIALLNYVAAHAQSGPEGVFGFMAEAMWREKGAEVSIGLKGTAVIYGEKVSLGYWLFRKPLAAVRRFLGV